MELLPGERIETVNDGLKLIRHPDHLPFGSDALLLAGYLGKGVRAAELGAGCGAVSLLAASRGRFDTIDGYELQESACAIFERNIVLNGLSCRVQAVHADIRALPAELSGRCDCVFSNPPYMKTGAGKVCRSSERQIARHETAGDIFDFCRAAAFLLKHGGEAVFVYRPDRACDLLDAMRKSGVEPKRLTPVCADPSHAPSVLLVSGKKGASPGLFYTPSFFIAGPDGEKTDDYNKLMKEGCFDERFLKP